MTAEPYLSSKQLSEYAAFQIAAHITVPLLKNGRLVARLSINMAEPRRWQPDEIAIAEEIAERTWATVERARAEAALRRSEGRYRTLYDVHIYKVDRPDSRQVVSIFTDITEDRQTEQLLARNARLNSFRVALADALRPLANPLEIQAAANQLFGSYLNVSRAFYFEVIGTDTKYYSVKGGGYIDGVEIVPPGDYPADGYSLEVYKRLSQGETVAVSNVTAEPYLTAKQLAAYTYFEIAAHISVPLLKDGKFVAALSVNMNEPRDWTPDEITIAEEMAERTWATVERAHAEAAVAASRVEAAVAADFENMRLLRDLSARSTAEDDVQVLYDEIVTVAIALTGADGGTLRTLDPDSQASIVLSASGLPQAIVDGADANAEFRSVQSTPLVSRGGNLIGTISTYWHRQYQLAPREQRFVDLLARQAADLIEQRQAEAEREQILQREQIARKDAERLNRIKDDFLAILSHELRTPLSPILNWTQMLLHRDLDAATTQKALEAIHRNGKLQVQLVDDLLNVAKILRGKLEIEELPIDLRQVIEAAIEVVRSSAEAKSISLQFEPVDKCLVRGNDGRLQQVIWNLLSNAIKFTSNGGRVEVRLEAVNNQASVTVTDNGRGIQPEFLPHLFESFRQEDTSITRRYGGLGLGLSIVKYIVDAHGGEIAASSRGEGQGAKFVVKIPLLKAPASTASTPSAPTATNSLVGVKILAVDDNKDARELLEILLTDCGAAVEIASSGVEVLARIETFESDVLVSDIGMPDMDGYALLQQVRALPTARYNRVPAIALTAFAQEKDRQQALSVGFQRCLTKPIESEKLVNAICDVVQNRSV